MARFDLSDAEWAIIAPLLPGADGKKNGRPRDDDRKVLNWISSSCAPGRRGEICPSAMARTRRCTIASIVGRRKEYGSACSRRWRPSRRSRCN